MSEQMNPAQAELVKVECIKCHRVVRTVANWGVVGEGDLARLGWGVDEHGKAVCDECLTPDLGGVVMVPCHEPEVGPDGQLLPPRAIKAPQNAGDLEVIRQFSALVLGLKQEGRLIGAQVSCAVQAINAVDSAVRDRIRKG